jgi:hypothetical protein
MDGGSADIASLHGCDILEKRRSSFRGANICPYILYIISAESPCEIKVYLKGYHGLGCGCYSYDGAPPAGTIYLSLPSKISSKKSYT